MPIDVTWNEGRRRQASRAACAEELIAESKKWRTRQRRQEAEGDPASTARSAGSEAWVDEAQGRARLQHAACPTRTRRSSAAIVAQHYGSAAGDPAASRKTMKPADKDKLRVLSFGDEIGLGKINYEDPKNQREVPRLAQGEEASPPTTSASTPRQGDARPTTGDRGWCGTRTCSTRRSASPTTAR